MNFVSLRLVPDQQIFPDLAENCRNESMMNKKKINDHCVFVQHVIGDHDGLLVFSANIITWDINQ